MPSSPYSLTAILSRPDRKAFTLVELLVVLIVISVLIGFTTVRVTEAITTAQHTETKSLARQAWVTAHAFHADNEESYDTTGNLRTFLGQHDMTAVALATPTTEPAAGQLGAIVYDGGDSLYVAAKSEDGEIVAWYRSVNGVVTSGSDDAAPPAASLPIMLVDPWGGLIDYGADGTGTPTQLFGPFHGTSMYFTSVSSDGTKVLVQGDIGAGWSYYVYDFDTDTETRLIAPGVNWWEGAMPPAGDKFYYWATNAGNTSTDLWVVNTDGTGLTQLTTVGATSSPRDMTASPDGSKLAYWLGDDIWTINNDGTGAVKVMTLGSQSSELAWVGDATNNWIYFFGDGNMSRVDPDVPETLEVVRAGFATGMTVTLDGSRIAWRAGGWPNYSVMSAEGDGSNPVTVGACPTPDDLVDVVSMNLDGSEVAMMCGGSQDRAYILASDGSDSGAIGAGFAIENFSGHIFWGSIPIANPYY